MEWKKKISPRYPESPRIHAPRSNRADHLCRHLERSEPESWGTWHGRETWQTKGRDTGHVEVGSPAVGSRATGRVSPEPFREESAL